VRPAAVVEATIADGNLTPAGLAMIAGFEGYRAAAYEDSGGNATIGYGHLLHLGGLEPKDRMMRWSEPYARIVLRTDCNAAVAGVRRLVTRPLGTGQFDALTSFAFNCGVGGLGHSTLLQDVNRHLGAEGVAKITADFLAWDHAGGVEVPGLRARREAEATLYLQGRYP
jgi:lysozyme